MSTGETDKGEAARLATADEVAAALRINPQTVRRWHREGRIPAAVAVGNVVRFSLPAVLAKLETAAAEAPRVAPARAHAKAAQALAEVAALCATRRKGKRGPKKAAAGTI